MSQQLWQINFSLCFIPLTTLFASLMPLESGPEDERGYHERQADGEVDVHSAGLVILLAVVPVDDVCAHECLGSALVGVFLYLIAPNLLSENRKLTRKCEVRHGEVGGCVDGCNAANLPSIIEAGHLQR